MLLIEAAPGVAYQFTVSSFISDILMLCLVISPYAVLGLLSYRVDDKGLKAWLVLGIAILLVATSLAVYLKTFYFTPEIPQNAQAGVAIVLLPFVQILGGGFLGGLVLMVEYLYGKYAT
ncbi:hypothetical protein [Fodinibius sp. AD559]|uniref:hypothetical protein n=1 Tax=Fodinibius sp. AD559 TaxID=3424179 RepID=UPI0040469C51